MSTYVPDLTRAKAEKLIQTCTHGELRAFATHANYHVRQKAWKKLGKPLPLDGDCPPEEIKRFVDALHYRPTPSEAQAWFAVPLTDGEFLALVEAADEKAWNAQCDAIKNARVGQYPRDWYERVLASGLTREVQKRWTDAAAAAAAAADNTPTQES
jgi:nitroreductase